MGPHSHSERTLRPGAKRRSLGALHVGQKEDLCLAAHQVDGEVCVGRGPGTTRGSGPLLQPCSFSHPSAL